VGVLLEAEPIICGVRGHGEHGTVVRAASREGGLRAGYVRGGRSRQLRPVLIPGNKVRATWRARTGEQLASMTVELVASRAALLAEPLPAAAIDWATALTAAAWPEEQAHPLLHDALDGLLGAIEAAPAAAGWAASLARYEYLMLAELGFGIDTGERVLPRFVTGGGAAYWEDVLEALAVTGPLIERDLLSERRARIFLARQRLVDRIKALL